MKPTSYLLLFISTFASAAFAAEEPLSIAIAVPIHDGKRTIGSDNEHKSHFPVIITNTSKKPVRFWQEWCSWGYNALTFELIDEHGNKRIARQGGTQIWRRNFPDFWTLRPNDSLVVDIYFSDTKIWDGFPVKIDSDSHTYTMRVLCDVKPDLDSKELKVWTGHIASASFKYDFFGL